MPLAIAKQRMQEAWWALEAAGSRQLKPHELARIEEAYTHAMAGYESLHGQEGLSLDFFWVQGKR
jgi:hypothetical protein